MSSLWDIVKKVGGAVISTAFPGAGAIIGLVNAVLPDDEKLPTNATGDDVRSAIKGLPPEKQAEIKLKKFEVDIEQIRQSNETLRAMLEADARSTHTTRPRVILGIYRIISFVTVVTISLWAYAVAIENSKMVETIMNGWPFVVGVLGPFTTCLMGYFGILKGEHKIRMGAIGGNAKPSGLAGGIASAIVKAIRK